MRIISIQREIKIVSASWAADEWTLTTAANHYLVPTDTLTFIDPYNPQHYNVTLAASTAGTTIKFASTDRKIKFPEKVFTDIFRTGLTGGQDKFTFSFGQPPSAIIQSYVTGTGGAVFDVEASMTGQHWQSIATVTLAASSHEFVKITDPWAYGRLKITSIDAATTLKAVMGS